MALTASTLMASIVKGNGQFQGCLDTTFDREVFCLPMHVLYNTDNMSDFFGGIGCIVPKNESGEGTQLPYQLPFSFALCMSAPGREWQRDRSYLLWRDCLHTDCFALRIIFCMFAKGAKRITKDNDLASTYSPNATKGYKGQHSQTYLYRSKIASHCRSLSSGI